MAIEHHLIRKARRTPFEVIDTEVEATPAGNDTMVRLYLKLKEHEAETSAFAFVYTLGLLSFLDAHHRGGLSEVDYDSDDQWTVDDMVGHLEFVRGAIYFHADYVRGRCMKTFIEVLPEGEIKLSTVYRGEAAVRWVDRLRGVEPLHAVR